MIGLNEVAKHDVLGALSLLYLIEPLSHLKHLHLDELKIDTLLLVFTNIGLILHILRMLLELIDTFHHIFVAFGHILQFDTLIKLIQVGFCQN